MSSNDIKSMMDIVSGDFSQEELHEGNAEVGGVNRREFLKTAVGTAAVAALAISSVRQAHAADAVPNNPYATKDNPYATKDNPYATKYNPYATGTDYSKIPQRLHKYPSSDKAKKIVHDSITIDTLFSGTWP
jgi:membrane dipeptidase